MTGWFRSEKRSYIQVGLPDQSFTGVGMLRCRDPVNNAAGIADCLNDRGLFGFTERLMRLA